MNDHEEAWANVLAHPKADLAAYLVSIGTQLKGTTAPGAVNCPFCGAKNKFGIFKKGGPTWLFKCFAGSCPSGGESGGIEKFIQLHQGVDWKQARAILHDVTGIPNPWDEQKAPARKSVPKDPPPAHSDQTEAASTEDEAWLRESRRMEPRDEFFDHEPREPRAPAAKKKAAPVEEEPAENLGFIKIPDIGRNAYEAFWAEMTLSSAHRAELKTKRGMNNSWIDSLGFVTATRANLAKLTPLLANFPEKTLLKQGLTQRNNYTREIEVAGMLHGRVWDPDTKEHLQKEIIIIPYIDGDGRIIGLRPHKYGLSTRTHRAEEVSEFYNKTHENLRIIYGEPFLKERPKGFEHTCVICEGEFKAVAPAMCGVPAIGFQGIEYFLQNKGSNQAIKDTVDFLKRNKIREVIVVFDSEAKLDKPFAQRFKAETWARFTALVLEDYGFKALFGVLPDEWRGPDGKADWDGRLAWHIANSSTHAAGLKAASAEFHKFLRNRGGNKPAVRVPPRQMDWAGDLKEDIIMQELNKLRHVPKIFTGGKHELDTAAEITNWCHIKYKDTLAISKLTAALRDTYGGYYKPKPPSEALEKRALDAITEIDAVLAKHDKEVNLSEDELRQYRAAKSAAFLILYRFPKAFTDFTAESQYKVLCHEPDGGTRLDRLITFKDKNGRKSKSIQMAGDKLNSSQELRKFFPKVGSYHWWGNQEECDFWLQELDVQNYQRTITEIDTYGWNKDVGIYIMGDCAVANGKFIFPDKHGIIWHRDLGYKNSEGVESGSAFCHKPPLLFPGMQDARKAHDAIDWPTEQAEVMKIWKTMRRDFTDAFGSIAGVACLGALLQYLAHPELLRHIGGKPGFWVQGRKGSGKTKTIAAGMRIFGFPREYEIIALGSTKVGIERNLSQFCGLPVHIDEWRNMRALDNIVGFITNAFNEIGISKGTMVGTKTTRKSRAATIPIITGEDGPTDPALRSRYMRLVMASAQRQGTPQEQRDRYFKMLENADQYHRVGRFLFKHREPFAARVIELTREFIAKPETSQRIPGDREQEVGGICLAAALAANEFIDPKGGQLNEAEELRDFMLKHMEESCTDITNDVFVINFFADAVNMINRAVPHVDKYLRVCRGKVCPTTGIIRISPNITDDYGQIVVLIAYRELYDEYMADKGKLRETAPIARQNIQAELKAEDAWIKCVPEPHIHRQRLPWHNGSKDIQRNYWALDYDKCPPELQNVFRPIYEQALDDVDYTLTADGRVIHESAALAEAEEDDLTIPAFL